MAAPACMSNDGKAAVFIGTFLENGDAVALCTDCLPAFTATVTADMFGVDGAELLTWLQANAGDDPPADVDQVAEMAAPPAMLDPTAGGGEQGAASVSPPTTAETPTASGQIEESPPPEGEPVTAGE